MSKQFKYYGLKVGDEVNFVLSTSMMTGIITKFYFSYYNVEECSVKTKFKTYPHIELRRCKKVEKIDNAEALVDAQKTIGIYQLALKKACKELTEEAYYYTYSNPDNLVKSFFNEAEKELNGGSK